MTCNIDFLFKSFSVFNDFMTITHYNLTFYMSSMDVLRRNRPVFRPEVLHELWKIAKRFEEKIYSAATSEVYPSC